jgi:hypothetical protein
MSDWGSMMNAMDEVSSGRSSQPGKRYNIPRGNDDLSSVSNSDSRPRTAAEMENENNRLKANAKDAFDVDMNKYNQAPPVQQAPAPKAYNEHKGSYQCVDMYSNMLAEQENAKAAMQGYTNPNHRPPQPMMEHTQHTQPMMENTQNTQYTQQPNQPPVQKYGGSLVDQIKQINSNTVTSDGNGVMNENSYASFVRQDYNRKRGALQSICEKLKAIDINNCEPDEILQGMTRVIKSLYGE